MTQPIRTTRQTRGQTKAAEQAEEDKEEIESEEDTPEEHEEEAPTTKEKGTQKDTSRFASLSSVGAESAKSSVKRVPASDSSNMTLKPSELYLFKPTSRQDEKSARIFVERIEDARRIYKNQSEKLALLLPRCLDNEIAHAWYSALSLEDKDALSDSVNGWIRIIKRDFMGTLSELRSAASKESFNWNQGRLPTEYVDEKVGKLRIAGMNSEEDIVQRVYEGFDDVPELQAALAPYSEESLANFRKRLRALQPIHKRMYDEKIAKPRESRTKWSSGYSSNYKANRDSEKLIQKPKAEEVPKRQIDSSANRTSDYFTPCRRCEAKGRNPNHRQTNCPLRDEKKEKGFAGKEDDSSEEESTSAPQRQRRGYAGKQASDMSDDGKSDNSRGEGEILANFGVTCHECNKFFPSGNQLHGHLKSFNAHAIESAQTVLDLSTNLKGEPLEGISNSTETRVTAYPNTDAGSSNTFIAVIDSGFGHSAVNRELLAMLPHTVKPVKQLIIRGIGGRQAVSEIATFVFYIRGGQGVILKLKIAALIFDDLGTDLLISTDYIKAWNIVIDIPRQLAIFHRSEKIRKPIAFVRLQVTRQPISNFVVRVSKDSTIPPHSMGQIALRLNHSGKADLLFTSNRPEIPDGVITATQSTVMYSNQESTPQTIKRGTILGTASSIRAGSFATSEIATEILNGFLGRESLRLDIGCTCIAKSCTCVITNSFQGQKTKDTISAEKEKVKDSRWLEKPYRPHYRYDIPKGIVVPNVSTSTYQEAHVNEDLPLMQQKQLRQLAKRFAVIFNDAPGMARQPEDEWLRIRVPSELEQKLKPRALYRNAPRAKKDIDVTFSQNVRLGRMALAKHSPYSLPVFVVYKYTPEGDVKKARPVVDLRPLNDIAESDAYPLPLQEDILASLAQASYISSIDFVSSFYQHFLHPNDQYRTATVSHRGLEQFCVAPMGFKNSPAHNQRTFERLFTGLLWKIVNVYVDDVNIFTKGAFEQHLYDLDVVFRRLADAGYTFKASKTYLGFQKLVTLGKLVSRLGYSTAEEKLQAIANWDIPRNGHDLERFIGFVGWHRQQVPYFAQRSEILQELKTSIFRAPRKDKGSPSEKPQERKSRGSKALGNLWTNQHNAAFEDLKAAFTKADDILRHFDPVKILYVFLDASKELGFGVAAYQLEGEEAQDPHKPSRTFLRPIIFLSKCLTPAERNYWPTDLELAGLVWAVKQLRIYIEQTRTIIYTDHRERIQSS
ncbi:hypothetical protein EPUS_09487 [Endocarpon pusillum Z07020]|uniref:Reverse transcriptase n=1 Tax=Endocarpon pusillum (strain Z07020 / HMAS-L-300199) TaxID=1263415 RepID=U1GAA6_ENDPU|nr:uncharacterized protein EPUS_09487 [Endocarpon pusillum Z07020]ERF74442.1 hypothetical protein EPUS_09487 [Endocarpon pusillum Z07020]